MRDFSRQAPASSLAALAMALLAPAAALGDTYAFDKDYTNITFSWGHLGLSRQSARVLDVEGTLEFDPENPEQGRIDVAMRAGSITTGVPDFDRLLKSADFFDAARNPLITFRSTGARKASDRTGDVTGDLTILGTTKPVTLQVTWNFTGEHPFAPVNPNYKDKQVSGFSVEATLKRSDFGLARGLPLISDEIRVTIEAELIRKPASPDK